MRSKRKGVEYGGTKRLRQCQEEENGALYPLPLQLERGRGLENWKERKCIIMLVGGEGKVIHHHGAM